MDELAEAVGMDPLAFRLKNLEDDRIRAVLETAAKRFGWANRKKKPGHGFGLACGTEKGGYVGCCVEISMNGSSSLRVERVTEAWDSGAVVNPDQLKNQVEGAIMMGMGGALFEQIEFANGRILNDRLSKYRVPRFHDAPAIEAILIDRKNVPSAGAGEIPIVGIAPALANAIHDATGKRVRSMPLLPALAT
jgi:isoquinoline 1-oxidoreductase